MKQWEKLMVFAVVPILGILCWSVMYAERGWLRGSLIPAFASFAYKHQVDTTFDKVFYPVNTKLASYGFASWQNYGLGCASGGNVMYSGFSESVPCRRMEALKFPSYSKAFEKRWQGGEAYAFDRFMKSEGWENASPKQPLLQLYAPQGGSDPGTLNVRYLKTQKGVHCELMLVYYSWENNSDKTWVNETCERNLVVGFPYY